MYIQTLRLTQFKNHDQSEFEFCNGINCFYGKNGIGKTNVLDALHYICNGKSYFSRRDLNSINFNGDFALLDAKINQNLVVIDTSIGLQKSGKKGLKRNGATIARLADYIGFLPGVMIAPNDITLLTGNSDERRRFIDKTISFVNIEYLRDLMKSNKLTEARNELLKQFYVNRNTDLLALEAIDHQLIPLQDKISHARNEFLTDIVKPLQKVYKLLVREQESLSLQYQTQLEEMDAKALFTMHQNKDLMAQRTTAGVHKDDMEIEINTVSVKQFGSQGQIKSATIALNLASYLYIAEKKKVKPVLLLDDIFEKIDDYRAERLLHLISDDAFGQIFITDTNEERLKSKLKDVTSEKKFFNIERI